MSQEDGSVGNGFPEIGDTSLSLPVSATMFLLPLVPILHPFCHSDTITPYHTIPPISILSIIVPLSHFAPFMLLVCFL